MSRNAWNGNWSSGHLVSCRHRMSGWFRLRNSTTRGRRRRTELMFQVVIDRLMRFPYRFRRKVSKNQGPGNETWEMRPGYRASATVLDAVHLGDAGIIDLEDLRIEADAILDV